MCEVLGGEGSLSFVSEVVLDSLGRVGPGKGNLVNDVGGVEGCPETGTVVWTYRLVLY